MTCHAHLEFLNKHGTCKTEISKLYACYIISVGLISTLHLYKTEISPLNSLDFHMAHKRKGHFMIHTCNNSLENTTLSSKTTQFNDMQHAQNLFLIPLKKSLFHFKN